MTGSPPPAPRTLTAAERDQIRALAADLPAVWNAGTTTDADRKQLIRHLVEQVRVTVVGTSEKADVEITWAGGHRTSAQLARPVACLTQLSYYPQLARARELTDSGATLTQIAQRLNAEGFRPPKRIDVFTPNAVSDLLRALGIQRCRTLMPRPRRRLTCGGWSIGPTCSSRSRRRRKGWLRSLRPLPGHQRQCHSHLRF